MTVKHRTVVPCVESIRGILLKTEGSLPQSHKQPTVTSLFFYKVIVALWKIFYMGPREPVTICYWMDIHFRLKQCPLQSIHWPREHQRSFTRGEYMKIKRQLVELALLFYYVGAKD